MSYAGQLVSWLEQLKTATVTPRQIAAGLGWEVAEVLRLFDLFGLKPAAWSRPDEYDRSMLTLVLTAHEWSQRSFR